MQRLGCDHMLLKALSPNDNSKNQVYLGGSWSVLNQFPIGTVTADNSGDWRRARFKARISFSWISRQGKCSLAPHSQLILYPKYPEIRLSGFLKGCKESPSEIMVSRAEGRILALGISHSGMVYASAFHVNELADSEQSLIESFEDQGVFKFWRLNQAKAGQSEEESLLASLAGISGRGWIDSFRLDSKGARRPCLAPNCGGYTLEGLLGVKPNGYAEPDFLGFEIKQFGVKSLESWSNKAITLMTPEPTGGIYQSQGVEVFLKNYGYPDTSGQPNRINFSSPHHYGQLNEKTNLTIAVDGFDAKDGEVRNPTGAIVLLDNRDNIAAEWSFSSLMQHWNRKHAKAAYIPSINRNSPTRQYRFGNEILLCRGTSFPHFLKAFTSSKIVYDPGTKGEEMHEKPKIKRRSQFRIGLKNIDSLYSSTQKIKLQAP